MKKILIITEHADKFQKLAKGLTADAVSRVVWADSVSDASNAASGGVDLIVIDETLSGRPGLSIAKDMIRVSALSQLAIVSTLSAEEFHEASEGLGVLAALPPEPDAADAIRLLDAMKAVG